MNPEFLETTHTRYSHRALGRRGNAPFSIFWWAVALVLLLTLTVAAWIGCYWVFNRPERPANYWLLNRLGKLDPPKDFNVIAEAPKGAFLTPDQLYEKFHPYDGKLLAALNNRMLRDYIENYKSREIPVTYAKGSFRISYIGDLSSDDVFTTGLVVRANSNSQKYSDRIVIELIFPTKEAVDKSLEFGKVGDELILKSEKSRKKNSYAAVIHAERERSDRICFTLIPLIYQGYDLPGGKTLALSPPTLLNLDAELPVTDSSVGEGRARRIPTPVASSGTVKPVSIESASSPTVARQD